MLFNLVLTLHVLVCISLIAIVLVQRGRGAGLIESAAGAENLFGTKTAGFFVKATTVLAVLFFVLSIALTILSKHRGKSVIESMPVPAAAPSVIDDARAALLSMGFSPQETDVALSGYDGQDMRVEDLLGAALKRLGMDA